MSLEQVRRVPTSELLGSLSRQTDVDVSTAARQVQCQRLVERVQIAERRRAAWFTWSLRTLLFGGVLATAYLGARSVHTPSPELDAFDLAASGVWLSTRDAPSEQQLSDDVNVHLEPWTRLRSLVDTAGPVWLSLEAGTARTTFLSAGERAFRLDAGPYALRGRDATLSVSWEPHTRTFAVRVERGEVRVQRLQDEPRILAEGESLGGSELEDLRVSDVNALSD